MSAGAGISREAARRAAPGGGAALEETALEGIALNVIPDEVELPLAAPPVAPEGSARPPWHLVTPGIGALVSLWSREEALRVVQLSVESDAPGWNPRWPRWSYARRRTPKDLGGDALAAQDELAADESSLTLLVLPDERRQATLEFAATLDGFAYPGDFPFDVVMAERESGAVSRFPCLLRLRHPRSDLLGRLPAIYTEEAPPPAYRAPYEDRPFFERYLRGFDDVVEPMRAMLADLARRFDADEAPPDLLPWLSTWVSLALDENWPQLKRRRLIKEAVELYRWRGTRRGLARYLELYTGITPEINDKPFTGMRLGRDARLGRATTLGDVPPHTFVLTLNVSAPGQVNAQVVHEIIQANKPAHTAYELRIVERRVGD